MIKSDIVIVGGGPAGLMAAGKLGQAGIPVLLLEKMEKTGKKLRITGKGRCNVSNSRPQREFINAFGTQGKFLYSAFSRFFRDELLNFFKHELHIELTEERGGRIFPSSQNAHEIADKLTDWAVGHHVNILYHHSCDSLIVHGDKIQAVSCRTPSGLQQYETSAVLIATGGASYPATGSTGDGYKLALQAGHTIIPPAPALVPLVAEQGDRYGLQGLSIKNALVSVYTEGKKTASMFGEFLFTHFGLSGPVVLTLSREIVLSLRHQKRISLEIDFKPALDEQTLDKRLIREFTTHGNKKLKNVFRFLMPEALGPVCLSQTGVSGDIPCNVVRVEERKKILHWMKHFTVKISGYRSLDEAIVTQGGVHLKEIEPATLRSKYIPNLYFAGEVLDLAADTGGYNLQAAFSTGWCAAESMIQQIHQAQDQ
jgi:predicted Rossmann fold flavoprotein